MKSIELKNRRIYLFFFLFCFWWAALSAGAAGSRYKIGIVHSYEKGYPDALRYRKLLEKELVANGVNFEIKELFLNCDELIYHEELARASSFIDEFDKWGADVIALFNNQAVYSFLKCDHPKLHEIPIVFSGVYHPDVELIRRYPYVTGYVDIPDYTHTVRMIERIVGKARIVVMSGTGMIDSQMWAQLEQQCTQAGIETYDGDVFAHILAHRVVKDPYEEKNEPFYNEEIDTTVVMRLMSDALPLRTIQQTARGSKTYLMLASRTYNTVDAPELFANPSFAVINEGFGSNGKMLGGYFVPLETQLSEMAKGIVLRLQGKMPLQQITQCPKQYVLNWKVMQRYGISDKNLPAEYRVMYIPYSVRYRYCILAGCVLGGLCLFSFIVFLGYSLMRERKRKKEALRNLLYEHETLQLAIEGGTTYAWRREKGCLSFDSHFYKLIRYPNNFITPHELSVFVHPDDRQRFVACFLQNDGGSQYKEHYRCNFAGEYQWWEFCYSFVRHDEQAAVVTGLLQNIQEVKDREQELIKARDIAAQAELKQSFLNNMSHEIRTPLNAIVGFSNLLVSTPDLAEEEKAEFIDIINLNNDLLLSLINNILELSRLESGLASFTLQEKDLRTILHSCCQAFCVQVKPEIEFLQDFPDKDIMVHIDPLRLQQVVTNFLANANKFTEQGYIKLGYRHQEGENVVRIYVEDTGRGIPSDELEMIFSRFYKHDEFTQGTGLGLSICRSIIERMEGRIEVESQVGKGSCFTIVLPLH